MKPEEILLELETLGTERTKKIYLEHGAREPMFGVATGAMKPMFKKIKYNQPLADQLYATGNYDAMYFAGMIAEPAIMTEADFARWIDAAYFYMLSDYVVAVTLAESPCAQSVADRWIESGKELTMSAGWACYEWLLGWKPDHVFDKSKLLDMLQRATQTIHNQPNQARRAMNNFVTAVGVSYLPLHDEAVQAAKKIGEVSIANTKGICTPSSALAVIQKAQEKGKLGFKRKAVRC